jgi:hypothetical protein
LSEGLCTQARFGTKKPRDWAGGFGGINAYGFTSIVSAHRGDDSVNGLCVEPPVDSSVQVGVGALGKHVIALDMNIALRSLPSLFFLLFFHSEQHFDIHDLIKMPNDPIKLRCNVTTQGWCDLKVMTTDRQVHK